MIIKYSKYNILNSGAVNQLTKNIALEWAKDNIRANVVAPGPVKTDLLESILVCDFNYFILFYFIMACDILYYILSNVEENN